MSDELQKRKEVTITHYTNIVRHWITVEGCLVGFISSVEVIHYYILWFDYCIISVCSEPSTILLQIFDLLSDLENDMSSASHFTNIYWHWISRRLPGVEGCLVGFIFWTLYIMVVDNSSCASTTSSSITSSFWWYALKFLEVVICNWWRWILNSRFEIDICAMHKFWPYTLFI